MLMSVIVLTVARFEVVFKENVDIRAVHRYLKK